MYISKLGRQVAFFVMSFLSLALMGTGSASVLVKNFMKANFTQEAGLKVFDYGTGTAATYNSATTWGTGTFSNTMVDWRGNLSLARGLKGFATSGTWTSPTIDSGASGDGATYGLFKARESEISTNLALGKPATQSSNYYNGGGASKATDGDTNGVFNSGSVTHTEIGPTWWEVDLGSQNTITSLVIWNRTDCCSNRATNLSFTVSPTPTATTLALASATAGVTTSNVPGTIGSPTEVSFATPALGRYVRVWQPASEYLSLTEVQVMGYQLTNVALGRPATQISTWGAYTASRSADGNTNGDAVNGMSVSNTQNETSSWWQVDLGVNTHVSAASLWNRTDCCASREFDETLAVTDNELGLWPSLTQDPTAITTFLPGQMGFPTQASFPTGSIGRYFRIYNTTTVQYFNFAEAQVFGYQAPATLSTTFQIAASDSTSGPWNFVGPDGTSATSYNRGESVAMPYKLDGLRYHQIRATIIGDGTSTSSIASVQTTRALTQITRTPGGFFNLNATNVGKYWLARIVGKTARTAALTASVKKDPASNWGTGNYSFNLDYTATKCCTASYLSVVNGTPTENAVAELPMWPNGVGGSLSIVSRRTDSLPSTPKIDVTLSASGGSKAIVPLAFTYS